MSSQKEIQKPFIYENKNAKTMVIFIHGIIEGPAQFRAFIKILEEENFSYSAVLLDGHGQSGKDFARSNKLKWIDSVEKEILKHKDNYENIILVGHSMGGLLSILLGLKYKDKVKSLVLIATPLKVFVRYKMIVSSLKVAFGRVKEEDGLSQIAQKAISVERCSLVTYLTWIPRYIDLFSLITLAKKQLKNLNMPTLIVQSKDDELVSYNSLKVFKDKLKNNYNIVNLEKSGHFHYEQEELKDLLDKFRIFIKSN